MATRKGDDRRRQSDRRRATRWSESVPFLLVQSGSHSGEKFRLEADRVIIGRHPACDLVLDASAVSRQHVAVTLREDGYWVEDLRSRNGTSLNGRRLETAAPLSDGDELQICDQRVIFAYSATPSAERMLLGGDTSEEFLDSTPGDSVIMSQLDIGGHAKGENPEAQLKAMREIDDAIGGALSLDEVLPRLLDVLLGIFPKADRGFVLLSDAKSGRLVLRAKKLRIPQPEGPLRLSLSLIDKVVSAKQAILSADAAKDTRFGASDSIVDSRIVSMMCVPILGGEDDAVIGILEIDSHDFRKAFTEKDLELLAGIAGRAAQAVEQARGHDERVAQEQLKRDLELAHRVQQGLLPSRPPPIPGYELFDFYEPAREIGGDFFGYIPLTGGRMAIALADVSGKGVSAALVMAALSADVRYSLASEADPAKAVCRINESFCRSGWEDRFATLIVAVLDPASHRVTFVNAGHMPAVVRECDPEDPQGRPGRLRPVGIEEAGLPLGVDPGWAYEAFEVSVEPGMLLAMFTDGISEAMDQDQRPYGMVRVWEVLREPTGSVEQAGRRLLADVERHAAGQLRSDDMCLVCFGRPLTPGPVESAQSPEQGGRGRAAQPAT